MCCISTPCALLSVLNTIRISCSTWPLSCTICFDLLTHSHCQLCSVILCQLLSIFTPLLPTILAQTAAPKYLYNKIPLPQGSILESTTISICLASHEFTLPSTWYLHPPDCGQCDILTSNDLPVHNHHHQSSCFQFSSKSLFSQNLPAPTPNCCITISQCCLITCHYLVPSIALPPPAIIFDVCTTCSFPATLHPHNKSAL
jgi:hypothetical protein